MSLRDAWHRDDSTVTCIACGASVARSDAREYDREGDRWAREGKSFEFLCKPCDRERCHSSREGLEARLVEVGRADSAEAFARQYLELAAEDDDRATEE